MAESKEEPKNLLIKVKEESKKAGLKLNVRKKKIMSSSSITAWQIDGETVTDFIFLVPKSLQMVIAAMKSKYTRHLLLGRKVMTNLDSILKSIEITLLTILSSQSYGFFSSHVWM